MLKSSSSDSDSKSKSISSGDSSSTDTEGSSSSDNDSTSKSSADGASKAIRIVVNSDDEVVGCSGSGSECKRFYSECTTNEATTKTLLDDRVRRLSSKSSSSGEDLDSVYRLTSTAIDECDLGEVKHYVEAADDSESTSTSSSTDTSNKSRRAR